MRQDMEVPAEHTRGDQQQLKRERRAAANGDPVAVGVH